MTKIIAVSALDTHNLEITFGDGTRGVFDVTPYMQSDFFKELLDEDYFKQVGLFFDGIGWPHGQDLGPDTILADLATYSNLAA